MSNVSEIQYDSDFWTKLSPAIEFEWKLEVALVDSILKNTHNILRKDRTYDIKVRLFDFSDKRLLANFDSDDYTFATIPFEEKYQYTWAVSSYPKIFK